MPRWWACSVSAVGLAESNTEATLADSVQAENHASNVDQEGFLPLVIIAAVF